MTIEAEVLMAEAMTPELQRRIEAALLGALVAGADLPPNHGLNTTSFLDQRHRYIWNTITELVHRAMSHNLLTVEAQLEKDGTLKEVGWSYLSDILMVKTANGAQYTADWESVPTFCLLLREAAIERRMERLRVKK